MKYGNGLRIGVVGATGAVGRQLLSILEDRRFPVRELLLFSSPRSIGKVVRFQGNPHRVQALGPGCFAGAEMVFFDASDAVSKQWVPEAAGAGAWVIDNSSVYRMDEDVPLVVPEVNGHLLRAKVASRRLDLQPRERILAGPNCSTVQLVMALKPIHESWRLKRVLVSTYQSTSGAGAAAMDELTEQTRSVLAGSPGQAPVAFKHRIAFNCIPRIGGFQKDGYTSEEHKIMEETRKILDLPELQVTATAIRVPTYSCHGESIHVECEKPLTLEEVRSALRAQPGLVVQDDPENDVYPMGNPGGDSPVEAATGRDAVYVGRVRRDPSVDKGLNLWVVSDNLRKGAALNAVQIGEYLVQNLE